MLAALAPSDSFKEGRLGEERVGLIDDGGVMELWEVVSMVEEDLPETSSTLCDGLLGSAGEWKLAFERRRSCLKKVMVNLLEMKPGTSLQEKNRPWRRQLPKLADDAQEREGATVCGG